MPSLELIQRIATVDPASAETIRTRETIDSTEALVFYQRFHLLRLRILLPSRPLELRFADDGARLIPLALPDDVRAVNQAENLKLELPQVAAYLKFYFTVAGQRKFVIADDGAELRWLSSAETDPVQRQLKASAQSLIGPPRIVPDGHSGFRALMTVIEQRVLKQLVVNVTDAGEVNIASEVTLLEGIPVPFVGL